VLLDTKGPEIRSGKLVDHCDKALIAGSTFTFHNDQARLGDANQVSTSYSHLHTTVKAGDRILVDDGLIGKSLGLNERGGAGQLNEQSEVADQREVRAEGEESRRDLLPGANLRSKLKPEGWVFK
jgi:pyruvate kinase